MANILLNNYCNQKCVYCFAEDTMCKDSNYNLTLEEFKKIYDWLKKSNTKSVGLIGGEPTLNPNLPEILRFLYEEKEKGYLMRANILTNGTQDMTPYLDLCAEHQFLINVNHPYYVGEENYNKTLKTIKELYDRGMKFTLGITLFPEMKDYKYIFDIAKRFERPNLRVSYASPANEKYRQNKEEYYNAGKNLFFDFSLHAMTNNVGISLDCNKVPFCYYTASEKKFLDNIMLRNNVSTQNYCDPVIDIDRNGNAIPCFGGKIKDKNTNIFDFDNLIDLQRYFYINDMYQKAEQNNSGKCATCNSFKNKTCQGGCLAFSSLV